MITYMSKEYNKFDTTIIIKYKNREKTIYLSKEIYKTYDKDDRTGLEIEIDEILEDFYIED